jgi:hypothetical protein
MRDQPQPGFRITEITAFTTIGEDDEEGVVAFMGDGVWMPMIAADITRLTQLRQHAELFRAAGTEVRERVFRAVEP